MMRQLIKSELQIWITKKRIFYFIISIFCTSVFFQIYYVKPYIAYPENKVAQLKIEVRNASSSKKLYESQLSSLEDQESKEQLNLILDIWEKEYQYVSYLETLWSNNSEGIYDSEILKTEEQRDENLLRFDENNIEPVYSSVYRQTKPDLMNRIQVRHEYHSQDLTQKVIEILPDANYIAYKILSGSDITLILLFMILCLFNFNIWSSEFENQSYKLTFIQPYSRTKIFVTKLFVQIFMNLCIFLFLLGTVIINAYFSYGIGAPSIITIYGDVMSNILFTNQNSIEYVSSSSIIWCYLVQQLVFILVFSIVIHSISLYSKKTEISLLITFTLLIAIVFSSLSETINLLNLFKIESLYTTPSHFTQIATVSLMFAISMILFIIDYVYIDHTDLKGLDI